MENGKYIFFVKADVCEENDKDVNATKLLSIMGTYGEVLDYDTHIEELRARDKETIENLVAKIEAIKEQNLAADEIEFLNEYRKLKAAAVKVHVDENNELKQCLEDIKAEHEKTIGLIAEIVNKNKK